MTEFRAAIWAAVSSKPQYRNDSTTSQIEDARAEIRRRGWSESRLYEVPGHTRAYITLMELLADPDPELDAYRQFIADCRESAARVAKSLPPTFNVLICRARDRLGRTDAVIADMEAYARHAGATVFSSAFPTDPEIASEGRDTWVSAIERAGAQEDNRRRRSLVTHGKVIQARKGRMPVSKAPYGYRRYHLLGPDDYPYVSDTLDNRIPTDLIMYDPEAAVVRLIYTWYRDGMAGRGIAIRLNDMGAPSPGGKWHPSVVRNILRNPIYAGRVVYGRQECVSINGQRQVRDRSVPLVVVNDARHTAIIEPALFDEVQQLIAVKASMKGRAAGSPNIFAGLMRCRCGYALNRRQRQLKTCRADRFQCSAYAGHNTATCDNSKTILERDVRAVIMARFAERVENRALYESWRDGSDTLDTVAQTRELLHQAIADNDAAVLRWNMLYEKGRVDEDEWYGHRERLRDDRARVESELASLTDVGYRHAVLPSYDEYTAAMSDPTDANLRRLMLRCLRYIEWTGVEVILHWR
jgi:hypothetical protein